MSPTGAEFFQSGNMTCGAECGKYGAWRNPFKASQSRDDARKAGSQTAMSLIGNFFRRLYAAGVRFSTDDGTLVAAGVAYYVALSFFPLLLVLVAGLGIVLQWTAVGQDARAQLIDAIRQQ